MFVFHGFLVRTEYKALSRRTLKSAMLGGQLGSLDLF
ncbi:hypothetical protein CbuK_0169 [Coxiella burnetii CbuK_Q154]|nr:hypothetical protein CbuK_0169 [Coxiella burnetii CbuK_Q154]